MKKRRNWNDDPYTKKARNEGFLARSAFKLEEINKKTQILDHATTVLDLGAAPGSWSQFVLLQKPSAEVIACDLNELDISDSRLSFIQGDALEQDWESVLAGRELDLVLSDMAPKTTGVVSADAALSYELAAQAAEIAIKLLRPGGNFVAKIFMGEDLPILEKRIRECFQKLKHVRPKSTRKQSREVFLVGLKKKPGAS